MPFVSWSGPAGLPKTRLVAGITLRVEAGAIAQDHVVVVGTTGCSGEFGATRCRMKSGFGSDGDARSAERRIAYRDIRNDLFTGTHSRYGVRAFLILALLAVSLTCERGRKRDRGFLRRVISTEAADQFAEET